MGELHTPGPWKVCSSLYTGMEACVVRDSGTVLETVAEVRKYANAGLIAAAPELLETAKVFLRIADRNTDAANNLRAAIAKAEGQP